MYTNILLNMQLSIFIKFVFKGKLYIESYNKSFVEKHMIC